jgi:hypothetical protein
MKALLADLERKHPTLRQTMLAAMGNVVPSHLYAHSSEIVRDVESAATATAPSLETPLIAAASLLR